MIPPSPSPLRVFVSEYVTGGAWPEGPPGGSLAREGAAMLQAVVTDLADVPGLELHTTWDLRLGRARWCPGRSGVSRSPVTLHEVESPTEEAEVFERLSGERHSVLLIAPELDGLLARRCQSVESRGGCLLGPNASAAALCADKWQSAEHLRSVGIPTIPTERCDLAAAALLAGDWPRVIKPRLGAGSTATHRLDDSAAFRKLQSRWQAEPMLRDAVLQPWMPGVPASVAVLCAGSGGPCVALPLARQRLSQEGRFHYLGGELPLRSRLSHRARELASAACQSIPGLRGYVGVDLLLDEEAGAVTVVEINPRLTTSYLGYRQLALPQRLEEGDVLSGMGTLARTLIWPHLAAKQLQFSEAPTVEFGPTNTSPGPEYPGPLPRPSDVGEEPAPA